MGAVFLRQAFARIVHHADIVLRIGVALCRGLPIPKGRLVLVGGDAFALIIHRADIELCFGATLIGSFLIPAEGLREIFRDAVTFLVHLAELDLRRDVSLVCQGSPIVQRRFEISSIIGVLPDVGMCHAHGRQYEEQSDRPLLPIHAIPLSR